MPKRREARPGDAFHGEFTYRLRDNWLAWLAIAGIFVAAAVIGAFFR